MLNGFKAFGRLAKVGLADKIFEKHPHLVCRIAPHARAVAKIVDDCVVAHIAVALLPFGQQFLIEFANHLSQRKFARILGDQPRESGGEVLVAVDQTHGFDTAQEPVDHRRGADDGAHVVAVDLFGNFAFQPRKEFLELDLGYIGVPGFALFAAVFVLAFFCGRFCGGAFFFHLGLRSNGRYVPGPLWLLGEFDRHDGRDAPAHIKVSNHGHMPWCAGGY